MLRCRRELGVQFAREGIRVNALCPGPVHTPMLHELFAGDPERRPGAGAHPDGRFAEPEEIAAAVAFLASDDASFVTASTFLVDGGIRGRTSRRCRRGGFRIQARSVCHGGTFLGTPCATQAIPLFGSQDVEIILIALFSWESGLRHDRLGNVYEKARPLVRPMV